VEIGRPRDAALKLSDRLAQIVEIHAAGARRHPEQFARQSGDLATFGLFQAALFGADRSCRDTGPLVSRCDDWAACSHIVSRYRRVSDDIGSRRRSDRIFAVRNHRPDKPITATGHRRDPMLAARRLPQNPAQRRDLHSEVGFLDDLSGPGGLDQSIFWDHSAGPFEQGL